VQVVFREEHAHALRNEFCVRVTGEVLRVDSSRDQRRLEASSPRQVEVQAQLSLRLEF